MANIFAGAELPGWMQARAERNARAGEGLLGKAAGTLTGGLINAFKKGEETTVDPQTGELKVTPTEKPQGFLAGLTEARANQEDPLWKLKVQKQRVDMLGTAAQIQSVTALGQQREEEMKAWMADAPTISTWAASSPEKRLLLPTPVARSQRGMTLVAQVSQADEKYKIARENSKLGVQKENMFTEFQAAKLEMDPATGAAYDKLVSENRAFERDSTGGYTKYPSQEAINLLNQGRVGKKPPIGAPDSVIKEWQRIQKAKDASALQTQKAADALKAIDEKGEQARKTQVQKYDFMKDLENLESKNKDTRQAARIKASDDLMVHTQEIKNKQRDKENSPYFQEPKVYDGPNGSQIITWGKEMRFVPKPKADADLRLKSDLRTVEDKIKKLQDKVLADPNDADSRGRLLDAQLERLNLFKSKTREATPAEGKAAGVPAATPAPTGAARFKITELP